MKTSANISIKQIGDVSLVTMTMTPKGVRFIGDIAGDNDMSLDNVISQALVLFKHAKDAAREGKHVGIADDADKLDVEFTGL